MRAFSLLVATAVVFSASLGLTQQPETARPYKVIDTVKVGGEGGFDYVLR